MEKLRGTVKWFDNEKGFGFIINEVGEDVFIDYHSMEVQNFATLTEGQAVEYRLIKGWKATEVCAVD